MKRLWEHDPRVLGLSSDHCRCVSGGNAEVRRQHLLVKYSGPTMVKAALVV